MAIEKRTLTVNRMINAPVEQVYQAFTQAQGLREWFCDVATVQPRIGGRFYVAWNSGDGVLGKYTALVPNQTISLALRAFDHGDHSQATITLASQGDTTNLTLVDVSDGADWLKIANEIEQGWNDGLDNLKSVLETGIDQREANRPMLGINLAENRPDDPGVRLGGTLEGMDAQKAGLQKDDILLSIGEKATPDWAGLTTVLQTFKAGDEVNVVYLRAGEERTLTVTLSPRPMPTVPATAAELAAMVEKAYAEINTELTEPLSNVADERCDQPPAPGEWNVKQIFAHLIASERSIQDWICTMIGGQERTQDDWEGNLPARIAAVIHAYPTGEALLQEFMYNEAESVALLRLLPAEFVARRSSYYRVAREMINWVDHTREHGAQIRAALG